MLADINWISLGAISVIDIVCIRIFKGKDMTNTYIQDSVQAVRSVPRLGLIRFWIWSFVK